ncbi:hypothetical protein [Candidatus Magnetaquicoccus inordinatus]|uniref:hypothetical protein n=1 Tax=Candidatus Magnetaquicoccus inordinatus TaxID=2496818 RepID=UPI00102B9976|nr:hypothetical protein [Candidatus Magnetaquicoccus inordinatus]
MEPLQIVANREEYKIFDRDQGKTVVTGINSFRGAWAIYERLISLKDAITRYAKQAAPHRPSIDHGTV